MKTKSLILVGVGLVAAMATFVLRFGAATPEPEGSQVIFDNSIDVSDGDKVGFYRTLVSRILSQSAPEGEPWWPVWVFRWPRDGLTSTGRVLLLPRVDSVEFQASFRLATPSKAGRCMFYCEDSKWMELSPSRDDLERMFPLGSTISQSQLEALCPNFLSVEGGHPVSITAGWGDVNGLMITIENGVVVSGR